MKLPTRTRGPWRQGGPWLLAGSLALLVILAAVLAQSARHSNAPAAGGPAVLADGSVARPRLVVTIVVDQMRAAEEALDARFGAHDWVQEYVEPYLYLSDDAARLARAEAAQVQAVAARAVAQIPGVYNTYPRAQIEEGRLGSTDLAQRLYKGFYPKVSGDVLVVAEQGWFTEETPGKSAATHGSPYAYDTSVPLLLAGFGIRPGTYREDVCPADLAPSLCALLGVGRPSACDGALLASALR